MRPCPSGQIPARRSMADLDGSRPGRLRVAPAGICQSPWSLALFLVQFFVVGIVASLASVGQACGTQVGDPNAPITTVSSQTWTPTGSPYCGNGNLYPLNVTIQPGVCVLVNGPGPYSIRVGAATTAAGTEAAPIVFRAVHPGAPWQGLVFNQNSNANLTWCHMEGSSQSGITLTHSAPVINSSTVPNNAAPNGGGLNMDLSTSGLSLTLTGCRIPDNTSSDHGGGVWVQLGSGTLELQGCTLGGNEANPGLANGKRRGGGLYCLGSGGSLVTSDCLIHVNGCWARCNSICCWVHAWRGGLYADGVNVTLSTSTVSGNRAQPIDVASFGCEHNRGYGGGIYFFGPSGILSITNCVVSLNSSYRGGPIPWGSAAASTRTPGRRTSRIAPSR